MKCRSCGGNNFVDVIDLGLMPLVNNLLDRPDQDCPRWPLKAVCCLECSLVQLMQTPPPQAMFDNYLYYSSQSETMVAHAAALIERFVQPGQKVLEIASNDGYLLGQARQCGAQVLGVDPARNLAAFAEQHGVPTRCEYFNEALAREIVQDWGHADVVFANNVLAHVPDPNELAAGIKVLLAPHGVAHIEVPYVLRMLESRAFDTIYHEHHSYFSLTALACLFHRHGCALVDVEVPEIHGGSLHVQIQHTGDESKAGAMCARERDIGVKTERLYAGFADRVWELKDQLEGAMSRFETVVGYGAAAKGVVLLNTFGLDANRIPWVADVSPHKQGRFVPGTRQPIVSPQTLIEAKPQAALLLPWNIKDEVLGCNQEYRNQGGRFIVPIPKVVVI